MSFLIEKPTVSIITPVFNRGDLLKLTIESILAQSFRNFEYIIVDDCSTEDIKSLVDSFNDRRLVFLRHDVNKMLSESYNTGILAARGDYIAFVESDDIWHKHKLEKQIAVMKNNPRVSSVYCGMIVKDSNGKTVRVRLPKAKGNVFKNVMEKSVISSMSTLVVRRSCFDTVGLFNKSFDPASSYEFELRLAKSTIFDFIPDIAVDYLHHEKNLSNEIDKDILAQTTFHQAVMDSYSSEFRKYPSQYVKKLSSLGMNYLILGNAKRARGLFYSAIKIEPNFKNMRNMMLSFMPMVSKIIKLKRQSAK